VPVTVMGDSHKIATRLGQEKLDKYSCARQATGAGTRLQEGFKGGVVFRHSLQTKRALG